MKFDLSKLPLSFTHHLVQAGADAVKAVGNVERSIGDSIANPIVKALRPQAQAGSSFRAHGRKPWDAPIAPGGGQRKKPGTPGARRPGYGDLSKYNPISI